jgi:hypothetical protein
VLKTESREISVELYQHHRDSSDGGQVGDVYAQEEEEACEIADGRTGDRIDSCDPQTTANGSRNAKTI